MISRRRFVSLSAASVFSPSIFAPSLLRAQGKYPERTIKFVVPFAPGGVYDAFARPFAEKVKPWLGNVVIENVGGAGGAIGAAQVARAAPDGYTMLLGGGGPNIIIPAASKKINYDAQKDLDPVCINTLNGLGISVHPSLPVKTLPELIDYIRKNPASSPMVRQVLGPQRISARNCSSRSRESRICRTCPTRAAASR